MNLWNRFIERGKLTRSIREATKLTSSTINRFTNPSTLALFEAIVQRSFASIKLLDDNLRNSSPQSDAEYLQRRLQVFFDCVCFLRHITAFFVYSKFGEHKMKVVVDDLLPPLLVEFTVSHFYKPVSSESTPKNLDGFKQRYYDYLNESDREYASCEEFILRPEDDFAYKVGAGSKSKGKLNLLVDNIYRVLNDHNPATYLHVMEIIMSTTDLKRFEQIIINAAKAI